WNAFGLHKAVVGHGCTLELPVARVLASLGFVPMHLIGGVMHAAISRRSVSRSSNVVPPTQNWHKQAASPLAEFGFKDGTTTIKLPSLIPSSHSSVPRRCANFGMRTLARS